MMLRKRRSRFGGSLIKAFARRTMVPSAIAGCTLFQFGGCDLGQFNTTTTTTTTTTLDPVQVFVQIVRGLIVAPLDSFITESINDAFTDDN